MREIDPDRLDKVSAIWIVACNDKDAIITYKSIIQRFPSWELKEDEVRQLVKEHGELFSPVVASDWLDDWKNWVKTGHYPGWVIDLHADDSEPKTTLQNRRNDEIDKLKRKDVFRCQLRTDTRSRPPMGPPDPSVPPCGTDAVKVGLEHIDRLRKAGVEMREEKLKRYTGLIIPALAILMSGATALLSGAVAGWSVYSSRQATSVAAAETEVESEVKLWDLEARVRGDAYESTLDALQLAFDAAERDDESETQKQLTHIRLNLFKLEPLILQAESREEIWGDYNRFQKLILVVLDNSRRGSGPDSKVTQQINDLREQIHDRLFGLVIKLSPTEFDPMQKLRDAVQ